MIYNRHIMLKTLLYSFFSLSFYTDCNTNHGNKKNNEKLHKNHHYYIDKTIKKININKQYKIEGSLILQNGSKYSKQTIHHHNDISALNDMKSIINKFTFYQNKHKTNSCPDVFLNIDLQNKLELKSPFIQLSAEKNSSKMNIKVKIGPLSMNKKEKVDEYPVIAKFISNKDFHLQDMNYLLCKMEKTTALLFYHAPTDKKTTNNKDVNNFMILILGNNREQHYHISNIVGIIFSIDNRVVMVDVKSIKIN